MGNFFRTTNGMIVIIAGIIVVGGMIGITIYYAVDMNSNDNSTTTTKAPTTEPGITDPPTTDPGITDPPTTKPGITDPPTTEPDITDPPTTESENTDPPTTEPENTDPTTTESENTDPTTTESPDPTTTTTESVPTSTKEPPLELPSKPLIASTTEHRIVMLDLNRRTSSKLVTYELSNINSFEYYQKKKVVFYGMAEADKPVQLFNGTSEHSMAYSRQWTKTAMAIDYATDKIYLIDGIAEKLYVMDMNNDHYAVVSTELDKPKDILIDSERRLMFILQESSIISAHMDGLKVQKIVEDSSIKAFAIDRKNATIYYANDKFVYNINYVINNSSQVAEIYKNVLSMTVYDNQLLFVFNNGKKNQLESCSLLEGCKNFEAIMTENEDIAVLSQIKAHDIDDENVKNSCGRYNGGCQHLCISTVEGFKCKCNTGWQLNYDLKTCSVVDTYLMYIVNNKLNGRILDITEKTFVDMDLHSELDNSKAIGFFDYYSHGNLLIHASGSKVHYKNLLDNRYWTFDDNSQCDIIPVVDWVAQNVYNVKNCNETKSHVTVRKMDENFRNEKKLFEYEGTIKHFVVLPNLSRVYFSNSSDNKTGEYLLVSANLNGQNRSQVQGHAISKLGLAVDSENQLLYHSNPTQVFEVDARDLIVKDFFNIRSIRKPKSISVYNGAVYVANATDIWLVARKKEPVRILQVKEEIQSFRVYSKKLQPIDVERQPCALENGGCQRFCFALPWNNGTQLKRQCACNDDEQLASDDKTCFKPSL